jgi:FixJ family two-component response regulator
MTKQRHNTDADQQTVFIVDDDASICEGLSNLLEALGMKAEPYSSAEMFFEHWDSARSGCLLLDGRLPGMTGVEFHDKMLQAGSTLPIIFMTAHGDIPMVRKVMKSGAIEFLTKPFPKEELLHAIEQAFTIDRDRRREEKILNSIRGRAASLTEREREVMSMVTAGMLNKQIAAELNLSEIMVKTHRRHVMDKMGAESLADLVKLSERIKMP